MAMLRCCGLRACRLGDVWTEAEGQQGEQEEDNKGRRGQEEEKTEDKKTTTGRQGLETGWRPRPRWCQQEDKKRRTREDKKAAAKLHTRKDKKRTTGGQCPDTAFTNSKLLGKQEADKRREQAWPARPEDNSRTTANTRRTRGTRGFFRFSRSIMSTLAWATSPLVGRWLGPAPAFWSSKNFLLWPARVELC